MTAPDELVELADPTRGLSKRFIRQWKEPDALTLFDQAVALVMSDGRAISFIDKFDDALTFLTERAAPDNSA